MLTIVTSPPKHARKSVCSMLYSALASITEHVQFPNTHSLPQFSNAHSMPVNKATRDLSLVLICPIPTDRPANDVSMPYSLDQEQSGLSAEQCSGRFSVYPKAQ